MIITSMSLPPKTKLHDFADFYGFNHRIGEHPECQWHHLQDLAGSDVDLSVTSYFPCTVPLSLTKVTSMCLAAKCPEFLICKPEVRYLCHLTDVSFWRERVVWKWDIRSKHRKEGMQTTLHLNFIYLQLSEPPEYVHTGLDPTEHFCRWMMGVWWFASLFCSWGLLSPTSSILGCSVYVGEWVRKLHLTDKIPFISEYFQVDPSHYVQLLYNHSI